jgi:hypothetical protein
MIDDKKNEKLETAAQDPSRRAAMGVGLAAAIAVLARLATGTASAETATTKTGTKYVKKSRAKTNTKYVKKSLPKTKAMFPVNTNRYDPYK